MAKTKLRKFHKIKIHPNRWLMWVIAYVIFVAIAMVGYLKVSDIDFDTQIGAENNYQSSHSYSDKNLGFSVRYPIDWSIEANSSSRITFLPSDTSDNGVIVAVTTPTAEKSIRSALKIVDESNFMLDSQSAAKISNDLGFGHSETVVLVQNNHKLYVIRGSGALVEKLLSS